MRIEIMDGQTVTNVILATPEFAEQQHPGKWRLAEVQDALPQEPAEPEWAWYLDIGPFTDRFGSKAYAVDNSTDPFVQSFNRDLSRRKWVNLRDPRVAVALNYLAGVAVPGIGTIAAPILTAAEVTAMLNTPVAPEENLALRKLYFS